MTAVTLFCCQLPFRGLQHGRDAVLVPSCLQTALAKQQADFEATLTQHLTFIDRLMADKKALAMQVEETVSQLAAAKATMEVKVREAQDAAAAEVQRVKERAASDEKVRVVAASRRAHGTWLPVGARADRDCAGCGLVLQARRAAWQAAQIKDIRERTIRSLEPDINRFVPRSA